MPKVKKIKTSIRIPYAKKFKMAKVRLEMRRWLEASQRLEKTAELSYRNLRSYMRGQDKLITPRNENIWLNIFVSFIYILVYYG